MLNDELYKRNNQNHHLMSKQIIGEFAHRFKWHPDGSDSLLDIGCGPGDVTNDVILPLLPEQFNRIVCSDISERMIGAARTTVRNPKAAFEVLDIGIPLEESNSTWATPFDHVTSFFCLHWVQDQRQALLNIFKLLVPGGNCLLTFVGGYSGFTVFAKMAQLPRWAPYMQNLQQFTPPTQYSSDIAGDIKSYMQEVGFSEYDVEVRDEKWEFDGIDNFKCELSFDNKIVNI